jgi:hypothetical protein
MQDLSAVVLLAGLFAAMGLLWVPSSWLSWCADGVTRLLSDPADRAGTAGDGSEAGTQEWEALTRPYVRGRLDALAEELERLERDPDVFAKAFHTMAARSALESLLADASGLTDRPTRAAGQVGAAGRVGPVGQRFEIEAPGTSTGPLEELEL